MSDFHESTNDRDQARGEHWRRLDPPVRVRGYFANQWHDVMAVDVNDDTLEVRVELPAMRDDGGLQLVTHKVITAGLYEAPPGTLR